MDQFNTFLTDQLGPAGPLLLLGGAGVFLVVLAIALLLKPSNDPLDKLKKARRSQDVANKKSELRVTSGSDKLEKYSSLLEPQNKEEYSAIQLKLLQAGYPSKTAVRTYHFTQFALGIGIWWLFNFD
jgi:tight adherence protein C